MVQRGFRVYVGSGFRVGVTNTAVAIMSTAIVMFTILATVLLILEILDCSTVAV